jgi:YggT family protein
MLAAISISRFVSLVFYFYYILIIIRIFLTWIPSIRWDEQPFAAMRSVTDPFLDVFRKFIPPIGGVLDITPIIALIVLQVVQGFVVQLLVNLGL